MTKRPSATKPSKKKTEPVIIVALIGLLGTIITAFLSSPILISLFQKTPVATTTPSALVSLSEPSLNIPISTPSPTLPVLRLDSDYEIKDVGSTKAKLETKYESMKDFYNELMQPDTPLMDITDYLLYAGVFADFELGVTSLSGLEWLQVEPYVYVRIDNIEEYTGIPPDSFASCRGGAHYTDFFVTFPSNQDLQVGTIIPSEKNPTFDYYSLQPGERAVYKVEITPMKPGIYDFSLGLKFWHDGEIQEVWTPDSYRMIVYDKYRYFVDAEVGYCYFSENRGVKGYDCYYKPTENDLYACDESLRYDP